VSPRAETGIGPRVELVAVEGEPHDELRRVVYRVTGNVWLPLQSEDVFREARWLPLTREGLPVVGASER